MKRSLAPSPRVQRRRCRGKCQLHCFPFRQSSRPLAAEVYLPPETDSSLSSALTTPIASQSAFLASVAALLSALLPTHLTAASTDISYIFSFKSQRCCSLPALPCWPLLPGCLGVCPLSHRLMFPPFLPLAPSFSMKMALNSS